MNFTLSIKPNKINNNAENNEFEKLYKLIYSICDNYYKNKLSDNQIKQSFEKLPNLYNLFNSIILKEIKSCYITYIEAILILYLENRKPKYVKLLSSGTFNVVFEMSLCFNNNESKNYALRLSKNAICKMNLIEISKQNWYDNMLYYNDISLIKYLNRYPNICDSCYYPHILNSNSNTIYYTHWSVSNIYQQITDIKKYKIKYIQKVCELITYFNKNDLLYFDWKITNFLLDNNDNLILVDNDFENLYSLMAVCSTHRLTPDPATDLNKIDIKYKHIRSMILMYISAYLSILSIIKSKSLNEYYMSFKHIDKIGINIDSQKTINSTILMISNNRYQSLPSSINDLKILLNILKDKFEEFELKYSNENIND